MENTTTKSQTHIGFWLDIQMRLKIEKAIKTTLIVKNKKGVPFAVDKIMGIFEIAVKALDDTIIPNDGATGQGN